MDLKLSGKRALVTGSSAGIGNGIARMLAAEGVEVLINGRNADKVAAAVEQIIAEGGKALAVLGDLSNDEGANKVKDALGKVDILVNNTGGASESSAQHWLDVEPEIWGDTYSKNVLAAVRMIRACVPSMVEAGWGRVINIGSAAGNQPLAFGPDYGAAKGAILNLTSSLAKALAGQGVTVNTVSPGTVLTPAVESWIAKMQSQLGWGDIPFEEAERRVSEQLAPNLTGRIGRVEEIAHIVCMLASPGAGYVTGANIRVDGGQVLSIN